MFTGRGNSNITWTTPHDQRIVDNLSSKYELQYHKLDWTGEYTTHGPDMWRAYFKRYGFHFSKFGCTPNFFKEHESTIDSYPPIMLKGLSPIFSNSKPWEQNFEKKELSVQYFVRNYQFSNRLFDTGGMPCKEDLLRLLSEQVKTVIDADPQIELTENGNINTSDFTVLKAILARGSSSSVANFRNEYSYYLAPFELHPLLRPALEIPDNYRQRNEFQVRLIDTLESSVLDVPIASGAFGNKPQLIGPEKIPDPRSLKRKIADYLPSAIFSRVQNWDDKRKFKNHLSQYEQDSEIYESYLRRLQNSELYDGDFYFQKFYGDLSTLNSFVLFEFAVDEVGYTRAIN